MMPKFVPSPLKHLFFIAALILVPAVSQAQYNDPFEVEEILLQRLGQMRLSRFQQLQLKVMRRDFAGNKDDLDFLGAMQKTKRADRITALAKIQPGTKRYTDALWALGRMEKDSQKKAKYLQDLRNALKVKKDLRESEKRQLQALGGILLNTMIETGQPVPSDLVKELVKDPRGQKFWQAKIKLMQADRIKASGKANKVMAPAPKKRGPAKWDRKGKKPPKKSTPTHMMDYELLADQALKILGDLMWVRDYWGMMAYVESAHAELIKDNYKAAYNYLKDIYNNGTLRNFEQQLESRGVNVSSQSPMAPALYYFGGVKVAEAKALKGKKDSEEKIKNALLTALKLYNKVSTEYDESSFARDARSRFVEVSKITEEQFGMKVKMPSMSPKKALDLALAVYSEDNYKEAFPALMRVAQQTNFSGKLASEAMFYATACLYKQNPPRVLEAQALANFMTDVLPKDPRTHDMLYKTAGLAWDAGSKAKTEEMKALNREAAMRAYMRLFKIAPRHRGAAAAAYRMAETKWGDALKARKKKDEIKAKPLGKTPADKQRAIDKAVLVMQQEYLKAVPFYEVLTDNYSNSAYGVRAYYKLGWIYYIAEKPEQAAHNFLEFCSLEARPTSEKFRAKFIAGERYYSSERTDDALAQFTELMKWSKGGDYDMKDKLVKMSLRSARALIPWCHDRKASVLLQKATELEETAEELDQQVEVMKAETAPPAPEPAEKPDGEKPEGEKPEGEKPEGEKPEGEPAEKPAEAPAEKPAEPAVEAPAAEAPAAEAPAEKPAEKAAEAPAEKPAEKKEGEEPAVLELPGDFGLGYLTFLEKQVNVLTDLEEGTTIVGMGEGLVAFARGNDVVIGLKGKGLEIMKLNDKTYLWTFAPIACYRGGKLIGIYDFDKRALRKAEGDEASATVKINKNAKPPEYVVELRVAGLKSKATGLRAQAKKLRDEGIALQNKAMEGLKAFLTEYKNDKSYAPGSLLKIGVIYLTRREFKNAAEWLDKLWNQFPNTGAANAAKFSLLQVYIETNQLDKAKDVADKLKEGLHELPFGNAAYVAFKLFTPDSRGNLTCLQPKLAYSGLSELLRRAANNHPDKERASKFFDKAIYLQAYALNLQGQHEAAVKKANEALAISEKRKKEEQKATAYFFKLWMLKGDAWGEQKNMKEALKCYDKVLTLVDPKRHKIPYYTAIVASAEMLMRSDEKANIQRATFRCQQVVEFADANDAELDLLIQRANVGLIRAYALMGETDQAIELKSKFLNRFKKSPYIREIKTLPAAKF